MADAWCPITAAAKLIGNKWKFVIVARLLEGPRRFSDLLRSIEGVSAKVLAANLRELKRSGLVKQEVRAGPPIESWYTLTEKGRDLQRVARSIDEWATRWLSPRIMVNVEISRSRGRMRIPPEGAPYPHLDYTAANRPTREGRDEGRDTRRTLHAFSLRGYIRRF